MDVSDTAGIDALPKLCSDTNLPVSIETVHQYFFTIFDKIHCFIHYILLHDAVTGASHAVRCCEMLQDAAPLENMEQ